MPPGNQRHRRTKMVLPVRIWLDESDSSVAPQLAHTVDISAGGGRVGGLRILVEPGQAIVIQRGQQKAPFRVVWAKQLGPDEVQAGVESLDPDKKVWGVDLPELPNASGEPEVVPGSGGNDGAPSAARSSSRRSAVNSQPLLTRLRSAASLDGQIRGATAVAALLIAVASVIFIQRQTSKTLEATVITGVSPSAQFQTTESDSDRPHGNEKVFTFLQDENPGSSPASRVRVAEAPQGHPFYPIAPDTSTSGRVDLKIVVAIDGRVKQIEVLRGKQELAEAAVRAVRFWRYEQHRMNGRLVEAETSVAIHFLGGDAVSIRFPSATTKEVEMSRPVSAPSKYVPQ